MRPHQRPPGNLYRFFGVSTAHPYYPNRTPNCMFLLDLFRNHRRPASALGRNRPGYLHFSNGRFAPIGLVLLLAMAPVAQAFDIDRAFRNFDLVSSGQVGASELSEEERAEVLLIQNTFDQMERDNGSALDWTDCHSAETLARQQAGQLGAMSRRLASCARRNDLSSLLTAANSLESCARGGGGLDHCNSRMRNAERFRDAGCQSELRDAAREQRHLASFRLRQVEMCPVEPVL